MATSNKIILFLLLCVLIFTLLLVSGLIKMPDMIPNGVLSSARSVEDEKPKELSHNCYEHKYNTVATYNCNRAMAPCHPSYTKPCENSCV